MVQTVLNPRPVADDSSFRDVYLRAYRTMLLARLLDEKFASLYRVMRAGLDKIHERAGGL